MARIPLLLASALLFVSGPAAAFPQGLADWQTRYGATSPSADNARCQLCHADASGGSPWNAYGWDHGLSLADPSCDFDGVGGVSNAEAFLCIEALDSDGNGRTNLDEIGLGTQPGWSDGATNTIYDRAGSTSGQPAPTDIGPLDPDGSEPPPPPPPPPPGEEPPGDPAATITVEPGQSIQAALDRILPGGTVFVKPGVYRELADPTNGLRITKNGVKLIGLVPEPAADPGADSDSDSDSSSGASSSSKSDSDSSSSSSSSSKPSKNKKKKKSKKAKKAKGRAQQPTPTAPSVDRVILENAGNQRNGIVVVPPERTDCMSCHTDMAPPFPLQVGVEPGFPSDGDPWLYDIEVRGITIQNFVNNGLFTEHVDGFRIVDVHTNARNYGIFPTLSRNGIITRSSATSADDSGIWVETSENVLVSRNLVEDNVNGFEVSNSDDIILTDNVARNNSVGMAILMLPDIFDDRPGANRIHIKNNRVHDNNRENTARPGSILATVPKGLGVLLLGTDGGIVSGNLVENHEFSGIAVADYCAGVAFDADFNCAVDPTVLNEPGFLDVQSAANNRIVNNVLRNNGYNGAPPFGDLAADLTEASFVSNGSCWADNVYDTFQSFIFSSLPVCE